MSNRPRRTTIRSLLVALTTTAVAVALLGSAPSTAAPVGSDKSVTTSSSEDGTRAQQVLAEAESLFDGQATKPAPGRDATMVLRDLVLVRDSLSGLERRRADSLLARPTDGSNDPEGDGYDPGTSPVAACLPNVACFHWVETSSDKVSTADVNGVGDGDGVPDYIEAVADAVYYVQGTYVAAGYRRVKSDGTRGGSALPDIYLSNLGAKGLYGYCNTDQRKFPSAGPFDTWGFCVLDNDYSAAEFPTNTWEENLQVTVAHEYFHAVQFAYDYLEDRWFMEATATWAEDEVYDDVDDNLNYLPGSPLTQPSRSLDTFSNNGFQYGTWIFFRYLTELLPAEEGGMPTLVRDMWRKADGASGGPDQYSMQAVASVLKSRGTSLPAAFAAFADANRRPGTIYAEGSLNGYPKAPHGKFVKKSGWYVTELDHMTSSTASFAPAPGNSQLKVFLDMPPKSAGSVAIATVYNSDGTTDTTKFPLNRRGNGNRTYPFDATSVLSVEVTLVNASSKYTCWSRGAFSCQGKPKHDNLAGRVRGVLVP